MTKLQQFTSACREGRLDEVRGLLRDEPGLASAPRPLIASAAAGRADVVRVLLDAGADPAARDGRRSTPQRPLFQCLAPKGDKGPGHLEVVRLLVAAGADLSARGAYQALTPLGLSAVAGHRPLVTLLIELGAEVSVFEAAMIADVGALESQIRDNPGVVKELDPKGRTALHAMGMSRLWRSGADEEARLLEAARVLLDAGADPGAPTVKPGKESGFRPTPLWWAISSGRCEALCLNFIERGAPLDACLSAAAYHGLPTVFESLIQRGANVDERSNKGCTALHDCLFFDRPALVEDLLDKGANPNLRTPQGHTALHLAAATGQSKAIVRKLIEAGVDLAARDDQGRTAVELAESQGHTETAGEIQSFQSMGS